MKEVAEDEMVGWHHRLNTHESEQTLGDGGGQGSLACCSPWGLKESDTTSQLNNISMKGILVAALSQPLSLPLPLLGSGRSEIISFGTRSA